MILTSRMLWVSVTVGVAACTPKRAPEAPPKAATIADMRITNGPETLKASTGTIFFIDGKRLAPGMNPKPDDVGDIEMIPAPSSQMIFGPQAPAGVVRITTKSHVLPPSKAGCKSQTTDDVHFEFQVSQPAAYIDLEWDYPHPTARKTDLVVQFVVDTAGHPDARSLHVLRASDDAAARAAVTAVNGWRFTPAMLNGCRVLQLVQTPVAIK